MLTALCIIATALAAGAVENRTERGVQVLFDEESPDVFLAKATLQQYLSRVVRQDWGGVRQLTHPKALERPDPRHELAPWTRRDAQLKTFRFTGTREVSPGVVLVQVGEDSYRPQEQDMSIDAEAVYLLFKSRGGFLVADRTTGVKLSAVSDRSVRLGFPGYVDRQVEAQARREAALFAGRHR